ncbi:MAG: hypothetical protein ACKO96_31505, partial [Flammeovirgaceae bacterium]
MGYGINNYIETSNKDLNNQPAQTESGEKASATNIPTETVPEKESKDLPEEKEKEADITMQEAPLQESTPIEVV